MVAWGHLSSVKAQQLAHAAYNDAKAWASSDGRRKYSNICKFRNTKVHLKHSGVHAQRVDEHMKETELHKIASIGEFLGIAPARKFRKQQRYACNCSQARSVSTGTTHAVTS